MKTKFVPILFEEAELIYRLCDINNDSKEIKLSEEQEKLLNTIKNKLDKTLEEFNFQAFVKLSTRSPKDAITDISNKKMKEITKSG